MGWESSRMRLQRQHRNRMIFCALIILTIGALYCVAERTDAMITRLERATEVAETARLEALVQIAQEQERARMGVKP